MGASGGRKLRRRTSAGSIPSSSATRSRARSRTYVASGRPARGRRRRRRCWCTSRRPRRRRSGSCTAPRAPDHRAWLGCPVRWSTAARPCWRTSSPLRPVTVPVALGGDLHVGDVVAAVGAGLVSRGGSPWTSPASRRAACWPTRRALCRRSRKDLLAESATDVGRDDPDLVLRHAQHEGREEQPLMCGVCDAIQIVTRRCR